MSLAHRGVLFLDELPEFRRGVLEVLRQPLEEGVVRLARAAGTVRFPADFLLVAAMNPCPCGYAGDGSDRCLCDPSQVGRYLGRVSGPLVDRIDLHIQVPAVRVDALGRSSRAERTSSVADRVRAARVRQRERGANGGGVNARLGPARLRRACRATRAATAFLRAAVEGLHLSARAHDRVLKVARTVADLAGDEEVGVDHVAEAVHYRALDRVPAGARL